jgi:hypothetical protein
MAWRSAGEKRARVDGSMFHRDDVDGLEARMFRRAAGISAQAARRRPVIGICSSWSELNPCNLSLRALSNATGSRHLGSRWPGSGVPDDLAVRAVYTPDEHVSPQPDGDGRGRNDPLGPD